MSPELSKPVPVSVNDQPHAIGDGNDLSLVKEIRQLREEVSDIKSRLDRQVASLQADTQCLQADRQCLQANVRQLILICGAILEEWTYISQDRTQHNVATHGGNIIPDISAIAEMDMLGASHAREWKHALI
ncbi:hypothetical protein N7475_007542 [Penicillium sp. IBT 31633x]|nr:hypothetical protein N7475_007542 [Penicillium sp. IBT 31633x]